MTSICILANREIAPLLLGVAEALMSQGCRVKFIAADEYAYQLIQQCGFEVWKRPAARYGIYRDSMGVFDRACRMDAAFSALGFGSVTYWSRYFCRKAAYYVQWLDRVWAQLDCEAVLMFNGVQYYERITADKFREEGKKTVYLENGLFPQTAQLDLGGTNAFSEITEFADEALAAGVSTEQLDQFIHYLRDSYCELKNEPPSDLLATYQLSNSRKILAVCRFFMTDCLFVFHELAAKAPFFLKRLLGRASHGAESSAVLPDSYLFFPLQVSADSQLLVHADCGSLEETIRMVYAELKKVDPHCHLVIKEHPLERNVSYERLKSELKDICWVTDIPLRTIISNAKCVVTFNSSVGLQSLIFEKPVICLGRSLYSRKGLAVFAGSREEFKEALANIGPESIDRLLCYRFLYHLYHKCSSLYDRRAVTAEQLDKISMQIIDRLV